ncbi:SulP family inorganic anion transporter [Geodermatophilus sp. SYSU D00696]
MSRREAPGARWWRPLVPASLAGYQRRWLGADLAAGLTVWAVLVPESFAYATIAGVPPVVGLYAAVPALLLYALLGSSRHLVVGPMSATAALSAGVVAAYTDPAGEAFVALTTALALVVGLLGVVAGLLRLGFVATLVSEPVLKGFIVGLALTIIVGQVPALVGIEAPSGEFVAKLAGVVTGLGDVHLPTLLVGAGSLAAVLALRHWLPRVPASLVVVLAGVLLMTVTDLPDRGVEVVGAITPGLPQLGLPAGLDLRDHVDLVGPALGVLLVGFAEGLGAAKAYAARRGYEIDADRELLGLGAANVGAGLASGMVVNGSLSKTAVNGAAGARSQLSGVTCAVLAVLTLLFLTGLFEQLPEATLAAVVIAAVVDLVDVPALRRLARVWTGSRAGRLRWLTARADLAAALAALLGVLVFGTLPGLCIGVGTSLLLVLARSSRPRVTRLGRTAGADGGLWVDLERHPGAEQVPGAVVFRLESGLFFANADHVRAAVRALPGPGVRRVVFDGQTTPWLDVTGADVLHQLHEDLARAGVALAVVHPVGQVRDVLRRALAERERPAVFAIVDEAVADARPAAPPPAGPRP